jgi:cell division protease FtsH
MKYSLASGLVWLVILGGALAFSIYASTHTPSTAPQPVQIAYSDFVARIDKNEVRSVTIGGRSVHGEMSDGKAFDTVLPDDPSLVQRLLTHHVKVEATTPSDGSSVLNLLMMIAPFLLLGLFLALAMRRPQGADGPRGIGFGKSRARLQPPERRRVTLADVAGIDEAEEELKEIVDFLKDPAKFQRLGGKMPKGFLLVGPPGTGKTLLARAIAGEANVPFYTISGSDFVEMFVGVGAARVRDMFEQAKQNAPCIIFIDELDAVGRRRGAGAFVTNDEREQTLNQLLVEMDGFDSGEGVILLAATNRPDVLDAALLRPGRFDRQIVLSNPDIAGREKILAVHLRGVPLAPDVDVRVVARGTPGFSGADLANLVNEAALLAARRGLNAVTMAEFEDAKDKVIMGAERRSMVMTERERRTTAYHEAGHALVTFYAPRHDPLHKVTIIAHGRSLGATLSLPERDRYGFARQELESKIAIMFGGRIAEELMFGKANVTTGAADDILQATELAQRMVTEYGFSDKLGPLRYAQSEQSGVLGAMPQQWRSLSEETARLIDEETRRIVETGEQVARGILSEHIEQLHALADALLSRETLSGEEVSNVLAGVPVHRPAAPPPQARQQPATPLVSQLAQKDAGKLRPPELSGA